MGEGLFHTAPVTEIPAHFAELTSRHPAVPWRPAGPAALHRMVAATLFVNMAAGDAAGAWLIAVLSTGGFYSKPGCPDGAFVFLGGQRWCGFSVPLSHISIDGEDYWFLAPGQRPQVQASLPIGPGELYGGRPSATRELPLARAMCIAHGGALRSSWPMLCDTAWANCARLEDPAVGMRIAPR